MESMGGVRETRAFVGHIPNFVIVKIARALIPSIKAFFESDEGKIEFEKWKRQKDNSEKKIVETEKSEDKSPL